MPGCPRRGFPVTDATTSCRVTGYAADREAYRAGETALSPLRDARIEAPSVVYFQKTGSLDRRDAALLIEVRQEVSCFCSCPVMKPIASALRT